MGDNIDAPKHPAVVLLAKAKEALLPDGHGRERAKEKLIRQLIIACKDAQLHLGNENGRQWVSLWHPPPARIFLNTAAGDLEPGFLRLDYDPTCEEFVARDPEGPDALTVLAQHLAELLEEKTRAAQAARR